MQARRTTRRHAHHDSRPQQRRRYMRDGDLRCGRLFNERLGRLCSRGRQRARRVRLALDSLGRARYDTSIRAPDGSRSRARISIATGRSSRRSGRGTHRPSRRRRGVSATRTSRAAVIPVNAHVPWMVDWFRIQRLFIKNHPCGQHGSLACAARCRDRLFEGIPTKRGTARRVARWNRRVSLKC
jgi:hypothetical protein